MYTGHLTHNDYPNSNLWRWWGETSKWDWTRRWGESEGLLGEHWVPEPVVPEAKKVTRWLRPGWSCMGIFNSPRGQTLSPRRRWGKGIAVDASCNTLPFEYLGYHSSPFTWKLCVVPVLAQAYPRHISSLTLTSLKIRCFTEYEPLKSFPPD